MRKSKFTHYKFFNELKSLPLLESYICSFQTASEEAVDLNLPNAESDTLSKDRIVLTEEGALVHKVDDNSNCSSSVYSLSGNNPNFELVLQSFYFGPEIRIPIIRGTLCEDLSTWKVSEEKNHAQVIRPLPSGFIVGAYDSYAFLPNSFVEESVRENPATIIEKIFDCEVVKSDGYNYPVVKPIGPFKTFDEVYKIDRSQLYGKKTGERRTS